jgi:predicted nucleic acid-binding protein
MRVVDTSAWIEWLVDSPTGADLRPEVPRPAELVVPSIVQLELAKWMIREAPDQLGDVIAVTRKCVVVPLDTAIALRAADLGREYRLASADSIVYATAMASACELLTCDAHFQGLPHVVYVPKTEQ